MIQKAVEVLKQGGIVLYPTDTLYALGVDATNARAVKKLRDVKGSYKETSVVVSDLAMAKEYTDIDERAERIMNAFLPGKLTLLLPKTKNLPVITGDVLGIRIPDNEIARALARELGRPVTATSANKTGVETKSSVDEILKDITVDYVIDVGLLSSSASTVVDVTLEDIQIIREGEVTKEQLEGITNHF